MVDQLTQCFNEPCIHVKYVALNSLSKENCWLNNFTISLCELNRDRNETTVDK